MWLADGQGVARGGIGCPDRGGSSESDNGECRRRKKHTYKQQAELLHAPLDIPREPFSIT
jgi:hypothetical protein